MARYRIRQIRQQTIGDYRINNIVCDLAPDTRSNYRERYEHNIQLLIGNTELAD